MTSSARRKMTREWRGRADVRTTVLWREADHDDELKRRIAEAGHVLIVVVDDNPYVC
jgi:hypothetical protein